MSSGFSAYQRRMSWGCHGRERDWRSWNAQSNVRVWRSSVPPSAPRASPSAPRRSRRRTTRGRASPCGRRRPRTAGGGRRQRAGAVGATAERACARRRRGGGLADGGHMLRWLNSHSLILLGLLVPVSLYGPTVRGEVPSIREVSASRTPEELKGLARGRAFAEVNAARIPHFQLKHKVKTYLTQVLRACYCEAGRFFR
jgi:hypothetical protein